MVHFVSLNTFSTIPIVRFLIEAMSVKQPIGLVHCTIDSQPLASPGVTYEQSIGHFNTTDDFNRQAFSFKIAKYLKLYWAILRICLRKNQTILAQDYQVAGFILSNSWSLTFFNNKLIYFQFELVDNDALSSRNRKAFKKLVDGAHLLHLAIFPEINRLNYFRTLSGLPMEKTLMIPNSCKPVNDGDGEIPETLLRIPKDAIVFGHIGNVGPDHYIREFLELIEQIKNPKVYFIMVGRFSAQTKTLLSEVKNPNFILMSEVSHRQLKNIYPAIHYGFILYRGVDKNFEFCAPNKLYEYWAYGIPVIAHRLTGLISVVKPELLGCTLDLESSQLEELIHRLITQPLPDRKTIKKYFDENLAVDKYLSSLISRI